MDRLRLCGYTLRERGWQFNREQATFTPTQGALMAGLRASRYVLSSRRQPSFTSTTERETYIENLALAISTLEYRERLLYTSFREDGVPLPHLPGLREMNHSQQMALFNHLDRLGAFDEFLEWMSSEMLQKIEI